MWQDYSNFCQMPDENARRDYHFCRRFNVMGKVFRQNRWAIEFAITTATLDGNTLGDYYEHGSVGKLAQMIEAKQANRLNRENRLTAVRVWFKQSMGTPSKARVLELCEFDLGRTFKLSPDEQKKLAGKTIHVENIRDPLLTSPLAR